MQDFQSGPEIDFDHLNRYVSGDAAMTAEIFGLFKNQVDMWMPQLNVQASDDAWAAMTHSLKGTARAIGAMRLADKCEKAEALIGESTQPALRQAAIAQIENRISQVMIDISRWEYRQTILKMKSGPPPSTS